MVRVFALRHAQLGWCLAGAAPGGVDPFGSLPSVLEDILCDVLGVVWCALDLGVVRVSSDDDT